MYRRLYSVGWYCVQSKTKKSIPCEGQGFPRILLSQVSPELAIFRCGQTWHFSFLVWSFVPFLKYFCSLLYPWYIYILDAKAELRMSLSLFCHQFVTCYLFVDRLPEFNLYYTRNKNFSCQITSLALCSQLWSSKCLPMPESWALWRVS